MTGDPNFEVNESGTRRCLDETQVKLIELQAEIEALRSDRDFLLSLLQMTSEDLEFAKESVG